MLDVQKKLDELLEDNEALQQYVTKLYYLPSGATVPQEITHILNLKSATSDTRTLTVGAVCVPEFAIVLESILALISTQ